MLANDDDIKLHSYQDDLTTDEDATDPLMSEGSDDPTEVFGVPANELRAELDKEDEEDGLSLIEYFDDEKDNEE